MVNRLWEIAQGPYGASSMRDCLESPNTTISQQRRIATAILLNSIPLATNLFGTVLLAWLLDTPVFTSRYRLLAQRFTPHLSHLCTHKFASAIVLRIVNQKVEPEASCQVVGALFSSPNDHVLTEVLGDQVQGVTVVHEVLTSSFIDQAKRPAYIEATKGVLVESKVIATDAYRRLIEEVGLPVPNFQPNYLSGPTTPDVKGKFSDSPKSYGVLRLSPKYLEMGGQNPQSGSPQPPQLPTDPAYGNQSVPQRSRSSNAVSAFPLANDLFNSSARPSENSSSPIPKRRRGDSSPDAAAAAAATSSTISMPTISYGAQSPVLSSAGAIHHKRRRSKNHASRKNALEKDSRDGRE